VLRNVSQMSLDNSTDIKLPSLIIPDATSDDVLPPLASLNAQSATSSLSSPVCGVHASSTSPCNVVTSSATSGFSLPSIACENNEFNGVVNVPKNGNGNGNGNVKGFGGISVSGISVGDGTTTESVCTTESGRLADDETKSAISENNDDRYINFFFSFLFTF